MPKHIIPPRPPAFLMPIATAFAADPLGQSSSVCINAWDEDFVVFLKITPNFSFAWIQHLGGDVVGRMTRCRAAVKQVQVVIGLFGSKETQRWWGRRLGRERKEKKSYGFFLYVWWGFSAEARVRAVTWGAYNRASFLSWDKS